MKINRKLKGVEFAYDFGEKKLYIFPQSEIALKLGLNLTISKTEMFSLSRFILRVAQKSSQKNRKLKNDKS